MKETEVKIIVAEHGALFALFPNGEVKTILVDVHGVPNYGFLTIGDVPKEVDDEV